MTYTKSISPAATVLAVAVAAASLGPVLVGCDKGGDAGGSANAAGDIEELSVDQVSELLKGDAPPRVVDANNDDTRKEYGTVPGATLLSSYDEYDVAKELGDDKTKELVFYCGSTSCKAAEGAAKRALTAGYTEVHVMPAGIKGWSKAGKATTAVN